jgi:hypothetical protein
MGGNLEYFLDHKREIKLTKVDAMKDNHKIVVMKSKAGFGESVRANIEVTESSPLIAILHTNP